MNKSFLIFLFALLPIFVWGQRLERTQKGNRSLTRNGEVMEMEDRPGVISRKDKPPITDYQIISIEADTTFVDTTLNIYKDYRYNYLRQDNFEFLPFANVGLPYNKLSYQFLEDLETLPNFGAAAKNLNFYDVDEIYYYRVPTPLTELFYKTAFEQGQILDAFFTANVKPNLNFSIAYKGARSLGKYRRSLTSTGIFRTTVNYFTPNRRYFLKTHFVAQNIFVQENGGFTPLAAQQFANEVEGFDDRSILEVNFEDAENTLTGKRFYLNHQFQLNKADTLAINNYYVGHILNFTDKKYRYEQATASELLGESFQLVDIRDEVKMEKIYNEGFFKFENRHLGEISASAGITHYNYGYNSVVYFEDQRIPNRLIGDVFSVGAGYQKELAGFELNVDSKINLSDNFDGHHFAADLSYAFDEESKASVKLVNNSRVPNFNFLLYQSDYVSYNWRNFFENEKTTGIAAEFASTKIVDVEAAFSQIENYTYFALSADSLVKPQQAYETVKLFKIKAAKTFRYGKFALDNTVMFQEVLHGEEALNVPSFVTRNSLYYSDHLFERALFFQTGLVFNYFSSYKMNGYDPVLSEFYVQNLQEFPGFPTLDFFVNAKIQQTRIFFSLDNFSAIFTGNDNFSAPGYPYRDFAIRFGLVWNFFL